MEYSADRKIERELRDIDLLWLLCAAFCLVGAVTGTLIFSRSYTDADVDALVAVHRGLPVFFGGYLVHGLLAELPYFGALLLAAVTVPGFLLSLPILLLGGLNVGTSACCLMSVCGIDGGLYALAVVVIPGVCMMISRVILCHDSMLLSLRLLRSLFGYSGDCSEPRKLMIKIPLCAAIDLFAAALAALMRTLMYSIIS